MAAGNAPKVSKDMYSNIAYATLTLSAANTMTFQSVTMAVGLFQGVGLLINRIRWTPQDAAIREMAAATDTIILCLTSSNRLSSLTSPNDPAIIDTFRIVGVGVNTEPFRLPFEVDLSRLPGGGKLVAANPLYVCGWTAGAAAASTFYFQMDFTFVELADRDYLELIQSQFPANVI